MKQKELEILRTEHLSFSYPGQTKKALEDICLSVNRGEFLTFCGPSGSGKSTLLRHLKPALTPHGTADGGVFFSGKPVSSLSLREQSAKIGFVLQSPENQIVTDKVWHELSFGLESLGYDTQFIRRRVAEMASFFGISKWFYQNVNELSGGQKQLLNLASVMAMDPEVLILDEPTSQLDPIAASDLLNSVAKINRELGTTILITEHRLEEIFPFTDRTVVMEEGRILFQGTPEETGRELRNRRNRMYLSMPSAMRIWEACEDAPENHPCPVTVRDGRDWIDGYSERHELHELSPERIFPHGEETVLQAEELWFRYEKDSEDILKGYSLRLQKGEFAAILGSNGAGKSTGLRVLSGIRKAYRGKVTVNGRLGFLPQDVKTLFIKETVRDELLEMTGKKSPESEKRMQEIIVLLRLEKLLNRHPYDLSGGEQQRTALAKLLLTEPDILLLDEPTKGLDADFKRDFSRILYALLEKGISILMVSHDVEFCASYAGRCLMFFDGHIVAEDTPRSFFSGNSFYTTSANRMARGIRSDAVTCEDVIELCTGKTEDAYLDLFSGGNGDSGKKGTDASSGTDTVTGRETANAAESGPDMVTEPKNGETGIREPETGRQEEKTKALPKKILGAVSAVTALYTFFRILTQEKLSNLLDSSGGLTPLARSYIPVYLLFILSLLLCAYAFGKRSEAPISRKNSSLSLRTRVSAVLMLLLIPVTILAGVRFFGNKKYYLISLLVLLECMLPFFIVFEGKKPQPRELVTIAVLAAIGAVGRTAFIMIPNFNPVVALTIISGVGMGAETGFLVGSMTMLVSNFLYGQGPWTPWQMFAMGVIGFLAGFLYQKGMLKRERISLCLFGSLSAILIYGGIMNPASILMASEALNAKILLTYYVTGFPVDVLNAFSTVLFLWVAAKPMLSKMDRIREKYGLVRI